MSKTKHLKEIESQIQELKRERERIDIKIETLEELLEQFADEEVPIRTRAPRSNVKKIVLHLLSESGAEGLNAAKAVELAEERGISLERGSVSSLLSRLKRYGIVAFDGKVYRLTEPSLNYRNEAEGSDAPLVSGDVVALKASRGTP